MFQNLLFLSYNFFFFPLNLYFKFELIEAESKKFILDMVKLCDHFEQEYFTYQKFNLYCYITFQVEYFMPIL